MHDNFRVRDFGANKIDLRLHHREIFVRAALQNIFFADLREIVQSTGIDPDIQRKNGTQRGEDFLRLPTLALLVDDIALQEDAASHRELWHRLCAKRPIRDFAEGNAESFGDALEESSVSRRALRVQAEITHRAVL